MYFLYVNPVILLPTLKENLFGTWEAADFLDAYSWDFVLPKEYSNLITAIRFESEIH